MSKTEKQQAVMSSTITINISDYDSSIIADGNMVLLRPGGLGEYNVAQVVHFLRWNGERIRVGTEGRFLNPEWRNDKRKPMYLTSEQAGETVFSRIETLAEITERKLAALLRELSRMNKQTSDEMIRLDGIA